MFKILELSFKAFRASLWRESVCMYMKKRGNAVSGEPFVSKLIQLKVRKMLDQT